MATSVELPEGLEKDIREEVEKGRYTSKSELIRDAVRRLLEKQAVEETLSREAVERIRKARRQEESYTLEEAKEELGVKS